MTIVFLTQSLSSAGGGVAAAVGALSAAVAERDSEQVTVLGLADSLWEKERDGWKGAPAIACDVAGPKALGFAPGLLCRLRAEQPRLVHSHGIWTHTSRDVLCWGRSTGRPYLVSPHGMLDAWALSRSRTKKRIASWLYENAHLSRAACLHALCDAEAEAIRAYGLKNPVCVVPNGVSLPAVARRAPPPWAGMLPDGSRVLFYLGRLHPKKNLAALIEAFARLCLDGSVAGACPWALVIAGWEQAGYRQTLEALVARCGLQNKIIFLSRLLGAEKDAAFRSASAFVLPSLSEGLPMAALEAWSYGIPIFVTAACNLPEGARCGAAFEISPDVEQMTRDLARLLDLGDNALRCAGEKGRALVENRFTWDRVAEQMVAIYAWVLGQGSAPSTVRFSNGYDQRSC